MPKPRKAPRPSITPFDEVLGAPPPTKRPKASEPAARRPKRALPDHLRSHQFKPKGVPRTDAAALKPKAPKPHPADPTGPMPKHGTARDYGPFFEKFMTEPK